MATDQRGWAETHRAVDKLATQEIGRYRDFETSGGDVIVHDTEEVDAWIQASAAISVEGAR